MILRESLSESDRSSVLALIRENPELPQWKPANLASDSECVPNGLRRRLFLAFADEHLLGFAQVLVVGGEAELESMAVQAACRGTGVGRRLLQHAMAETKRDGAEVFRLEVRQGNVAAKRLYESCGMSVTGLRRRYYRDPIEDAVLMDVHWKQAHSGG